MFKEMHTSGNVIAATLFGVGILGFALFKVFSAPMTDVTPIQQGNTRADTGFETDTDNDGVRDWEEVLLGLDPKNPDSNGDGVSDGVEVAQAREIFETEATSTPQLGENINSTDYIAREIFGAYIQSKQQGTYDPQAFDFLVTQATQEPFRSRIRTPYTQADIKTTPDTSTESTERYKRAFQDAILQVTAIEEYELTTYGRAIEQSDPEEFAKLSFAADVYTAIATDLLAITVPEDALPAHLDLVNAFAVLSEVLRTMSNSPEDPILTFVATRDFIEAEDGITTAYSQMNIYFTLKESL